MADKQESDVHLYVIESIMDAIATITKILTVTKAETLERTIKEMTTTIPSMVSIPAETNLKTVQHTIKNMADKTKVEAIKHTIEHMASTAVDITTILPNTEIDKLNKTLKNTASSISDITNIFLNIDWENFEPMDVDVKKARDILSSQAIKEVIDEGLRDKESGNELIEAHKIVILDLMLLYHTIIFINDTVTLTIIELKQVK